MLAFKESGQRGGLALSLAARLRMAIETGEIRSGERLPASRKLSQALGVSRGTVSTAIETLIAEGLLETRIGAGTFVASGATSPRKPPADQAVALPWFKEPEAPNIDEVNPTKMDFRPCRPSLEAFPMQIWKRCVAQAASLRPSPDYSSPLGDEALRKEICLYLRRARGLQCDPGQLIVTNGALNAMHLVSTLCIRPGTKVIVEDPGYPLARQVFASCGAEIIPLPVDNEGLCVDLLPKRAGKIAFVCVTPSHQFPTGNRLSLARRHALINWAERNGVFVIEDDYDGEFRYDVPPLSPLAAMDNGCVLYVGTFSKTMFPGLRIGFAVGPKPLIEAMARNRAFAEYAPNDLNQRALLNFIQDRHYERHVQRMRRIYSEKRRCLVDAISRDNKDAWIGGLESGLNALLTLKAGVSARKVSETLKSRGALVPTLARYSVSTDIEDSALVIGYAAPTLQQIDIFSAMVAARWRN
ncbi:MAG: PLP-dependent aminotransferase family protein [Parvularculaceae bacterium]